MNALSTISEAVKTALKQATFAAATPDRVERVYAPPDYDASATTELRVIVVAFEEDVDLFGQNTTREACDHVYTVKVAITKRVNAPDVTSPAALEELDRLSDFREQVIDFLKGNRDMGNGTLDTLANDSTAYNPAMLDQKKTFVSVITAKYRKLR
jgi:hypothetical protein